MFESSKDPHYSVDRICELEKLWKMIVAVLPQGYPCDLQDIYAAMLRRFKTIPLENWEKSVREILVSESRRSDSPINQYDEDSIFVNVDNESWLSTREDYSPDLRSIVNQEIDEMVKEIPFVHLNRAASSAEDALSLGDHGDILDDPLAKLEIPAVPPKMSPEKTELLKGDIYFMNDSKMRSEAIARILQLPKLDSRRYGRELWRMALYDEVLLKPVFETFCELANQSPTWAEIVLDTIFCVELQPQDEEAPFNYIVDAGIALPPNMSVLRVAGLLYLLNYMDESPDNWKNVIKWLLEKHTNQFRSLFLGILINVGRHNEHLQGAVLSIYGKLINRESWESTYIMFKRGSHSVD